MRLHSAVLVVWTCVPHASQSIFNLDVAQFLVALGLDFLQEFALRRQNPLEGLLEIRLRGGRVAACLHWDKYDVSVVIMGTEVSMAYQRRKDEPIKLVSAVNC